MSDAALSPDLQEQFARIFLAQEETRKYAAEQHKLAAETIKLAAEARKIDKDSRFAPWQAAVAVTGGVAGLLAALVTALKAFGVIH